MARPPADPDDEPVIPEREQEREEDEQPHVPDESNLPGGQPTGPG